MTDEANKPEVFASTAKTIHEAIIEVMGRVGYVHKTKAKDGGLKYSYAGESALIEALRPAMRDSGISFHCANISNHRREVVRQEKTNGNAKYEAISYFTTGLFEFVFTHSPSNTSIKVVALGEGYDSLDKGAYKAMTGALKYALRQTFIIETGDDPDKYQGEEEKPQKPITQKPKQPDINAACLWFEGKMLAAGTEKEIDQIMTDAKVCKFMVEAAKHEEIHKRANDALIGAKERVKNG